MLVVSGDRVPLEHRLELFLIILLIRLESVGSFFWITGTAVHNSQCREWFRPLSGFNEKDE